MMASGLHVECPPPRAPSAARQGWDGMGTALASRFLGTPFEGDTEHSHALHPKIRGDGARGRRRTECDAGTVESSPRRGPQARRRMCTTEGSTGGGCFMGG